MSSKQSLDRDRVKRHLCNFKVAMGAGPVCVDNALGDALPIKVRELVQQMEVLQQQLAAAPDRHTAKSERASKSVCDDEQ